MKYEEVMNMTLEQAIKHYREAAEITECEERRAECLCLAEWLEELEEYREGEDCMTFREKLKKDRPDLVNDGLFRGGCAGCPSTYGYEDAEAEGAPCNHGRILLPIDETCRQCWDREYGEDKVNKAPCILLLHRGL